MRGMLIMLAGAFACLFVAPLLPPMVALEAATTSHKGLLLPLFIAGAILGGIGMVGLITEMNFKFGQISTSEDDAADTIANIRENSPGGAYWRKWKYKFGGRSVSSSFEIEIPFKDLKEGYKTGEWLRDPVLYRVTFIGLAAAVMTVGLFGTVFVLTNVGLKLLILLAVTYALVRSIHAWTIS